MGKSTISRSIIYTISKFSNWTAVDIEAFFRSKNLYADKPAWSTFIRLSLLSLGVTFTVYGLVLFFAFNWEKLHKFAKFGLLQALLVLLVVGSLFWKTSDRNKGILLTGASMLVGILFAVFGQVYQTGANAYDFFLGWTIFIAVWVFIANFPPLWLLFLTLLNITVFYYSEQLRPEWLPHTTIAILFIINIFTFILLKVLNNKVHIPVLPKWLERLLILVSISYLTISLSKIAMYSPNSGYETILLGIISYPVGIYYGLQNRDTFYIATLGLSVIMISTCFLIDNLKIDDISLFFLIGLFIVGSITALVFVIRSLNKTWHEDLS